MWLLKGIVLGVVLFVIGFFVYAFMFAHRTHLTSGSAVLMALTVRNPYFWLAFTVPYEHGAS
jgi:hypothetical protein